MFAAISFAVKTDLLTDLIKGDYARRCFRAVNTIVEWWLWLSVSTYFLLQSSLVETMRVSVILLFTVLALAFLVAYAAGVSIHIADYLAKEIL